MTVNHFLENGGQQQHNTTTKAIPRRLRFADAALKRTPISPWMDKALLNKKRQMEIARKKFLRRNNAVNEIKYRALKKEYNNSIQKAKYNYYGKELFRSSKDSKKLWSVINTIIAKKSVTEPVRTIKHNDLVLKDDTEIAEVFAEFYKHSALEKTKDIVSNVEFSSFLSGKDKRDETFHLKPVEVIDVWNIINPNQFDV